jgi:alkanesulfonate monooxygenase SsuD/methylene tetrahydromethanopterin reductase-like flavin-dependent oxidoreductase (luciferase family)
MSMSVAKEKSFGVMFPCSFAPESLRVFAAGIESAGFDELWVVEDCFFAGGLTTATAALSFTERIVVGIGILPAVARNSAMVAMEAANLERLFPGRLHLGLGHGVASWMEQIGAKPSSWLGALGETTVAVRALLRGESVASQGAHVSLNDVRLVFPPVSAPPVSLGVRRPKSLALAASVADGVILSEGTSPSMTAEVRALMDSSARITVYVFADVDTARALAQGDSWTAAAAALGDFAGHRETPTGRNTVISGEPNTWRSQAAKWFDAGANSVVLVPLRDRGPEILDSFMDAAKQ